MAQHQGGLCRRLRQGAVAANIAHPVQRRLGTGCVAQCQQGLGPGCGKRLVRPRTVRSTGRRRQQAHRQGLSRG